MAPRVEHRAARARRRRERGGRGGPARVARHEDRPSRPAALGHRGSPPLRHPELRRRVLPTWLLRRARDPRGRARRRAPARDPGLLGIAPRAHARDLPVRVPAHAVRAARARPVARGGGPRSRQLAEAHLPPRHRAGAPARRGPRRAARRAVHAVGFRRRLADELRHAHARDLRPVQEPLRPGARGDARAAARRADGDRARRRVPDPPARPALSLGSRHEAAAAGHRARALDGAGPRFLRRGRRPLPRPPGGRARVLAEPRHRERARVGLAVVGGSALRRRLRARGRRRRAGRAPRRRAGGALPVSLVAGARATLVRGQRSARARDRALPGLLRGAVRGPRVPDARAARFRVRRALLPPGSLRCRDRLRGGEPTPRRSSAQPGKRRPADADPGHGPARALRASSRVRRSSSSRR